MSTIRFIRHGESEANAGLPTVYPAEITLTARGIEQARRIGPTFFRSPDLIIYSPYKRAKQTALPTTLLFPYCPTEPWPVQEFTYLSLDKYRDTTIHDRRPHVNAYWERLDALFSDGEDTESFCAFMLRTQSAVHKLEEAPQNFIAIFSHEQFIHAAIWLLIHNAENTHIDFTSSSTMKYFYAFLKSFHMPNGSFIDVTLNPGSEPTIGPVETFHLMGAPSRSSYSMESTITSQLINQPPTSPFPARTRLY